MSDQMMAEFVRAKKRLAQVPRWARPVITTAPAVSRSEHLTATRAKRSGQSA